MAPFARWQIASSPSSLCWQYWIHHQRHNHIGPAITVFLCWRSPPITSYLPLVTPHPQPPVNRTLRQLAASFSGDRSSLNGRGSTVRQVAFCTRSERVENIKVVVKTLSQRQFIPALQIRIAERLGCFPLWLGLLDCSVALRRRTKRHTNYGLCSYYRLMNVANVLEIEHHFVSFGLSI